jgi:hypothetical protein
MKRLLAQALILVLVIPVWTTGCHKRVDIPKEQLADRASFGTKEGPYIVQPKAALTSSAPLKSFRIQNETLIGELKDGWQTGRTTYPIQDIVGVAMERTDVPMTILAILATGAAFVGAAVLGIAVMWSNYKG